MLVCSWGTVLALDLVMEGSVLLTCISRRDFGVSGGWYVGSVRSGWVCPRFVGKIQEYVSWSGGVLSSSGISLIIGKGPNLMSSSSSTLRLVVELPCGLLANC